MRRFKPKDSEIVHSPPEMEEVPERKPGRPARGRPSKLTPAVIKRICDGIANGLFVTQAARLAGVSEDAVNEWRTRGSGPDAIEPFKGFVEEFELAELTCEAMLVEKWKEAAPEDWRACKEFLSKRFASRWSDHASRAAVFGYDDPVVANFGGLQIIVHLEATTPEELAADRARQAAIEMQPTATERQMLENTQDKV